jgi:hypothetical protein
MGARGKGMLSYHILLLVPALVSDAAFVLEIFQLPGRGMCWTRGARSGGKEDLVQHFSVIILYAFRTLLQHSSLRACAVQMPCDAVLPTEHVWIVWIECCMCACVAFSMALAIAYADVALIARKCK